MYSTRHCNSTAIFVRQLSEYGISLLVGNSKSHQHSTQGYMTGYEWGHILQIAHNIENSHKRLFTPIDCLLQSAKYQITSTSVLLKGPNWPTANVARSEWVFRTNLSKKRPKCTSTCLLNSIPTLFGCAILTPKVGQTGLVLGLQ